MSGRAAHRLALAVFAAVAVLLALGLVLDWATRDVAHSEGFGGDGVGGFAVALFVSVSFLTYAVVGVLIASRRPRNPVGWLLLAIALGWSMVASAIPYGDYAFKVHPGGLPAAALIAAVSLWAWAPPVGFTGVFLLLVYPDGHLVGPRWRWVAYLCGLAIVVCIVVDVLAPGSMAATGFPHQQNPTGVEALRPVLEPLQLAVLLIPLCSVAAIASMVVRFRRAGAVERLQIKWLAASGALCGILYFAALALSGLFGNPGGGDPALVSAIQDVWFLCLALIPASIGVAMLRYRLFEIDVIIRRTLIYAALVVSLAAIYLGAAVAIGSLLRGLTGSSGTLAITVSTLAVAAAFQPLRHIIQRAVDRRFYRSGYDAQAAVSGFSDRLREQIDLDALCEELRTVVTGTVQPAHASVWLRAGPEDADRP